MSLRTMNAAFLDEDFLAVARQLCEMAKTGCARWVFLGECARWAVFFLVVEYFVLLSSDIGIVVSLAGFQQQIVIEST